MFTQSHSEAFPSFSSCWPTGWSGGGGVIHLSKDRFSAGPGVGTGYRVEYGQGQAPEYYTALADFHKLFDFPSRIENVLKENPHKMSKVRIKSFEPCRIQCWHIGRYCTHCTAFVYSSSKLTLTNSAMPPCNFEMLLRLYKLDLCGLFLTE